MAAVNFNLEAYMNRADDDNPGKRIGANVVIAIQNAIKRAESNAAQGKVDPKLAIARLEEVRSVAIHVCFKELKHCFSRRSSLSSSYFEHS